MRSRVLSGTVSGEEESFKVVVGSHLDRDQADSDEQDRIIQSMVSSGGRAHRLIQLRTTPSLNRLVA